MIYTFYERTDDDIYVAGQATITNTTVAWKPESEIAIQMLAALYNWRFDGKFDLDDPKHWELLPDLLLNGSRFFLTISEIVRKNTQVTLRTSSSYTTYQ